MRTVWGQFEEGMEKFSLSSRVIPSSRTCSPASKKRSLGVPCLAHRKAPGSSRALVKLPVSGYVFSFPWSCFFQLVTFPSFMNTSNERSE